MSWRLAKSLERLRSQVNAAVPGRSKSSDGSVGDLSHQARKSEHNPDANGVVRAIDITHDPKGGFDSYAFAEHLRKTADKRIYYIISNGRIANPGQPCRTYTGQNRHDHHVHISVVSSPKLYDDASDWAIGLGKAGLVERTVAAVAEILSPAKPATLKPGSKGAPVKELQTLLGITADGDYGPFTDGAVRAFQKDAKLVVDGIAGPYTLAKLKEKKSAPVDPFDKVMEWVFEDEGGVTISSDEPGGISTWGVSRTAYSEYLKRPVSLDEMKALTKDEARKFYRDKFWGVVATDKPAGLRYATFDFAINSGIARANEYADQHPTIDALCDARLAYLATLPTAKKYLKGWTNRITRVRQRSKTL